MTNGITMSLRAEAAIWENRLARAHDLELKVVFMPAAERAGYWGQGDVLVNIQSFGALDEPPLDTDLKEEMLNQIISSNPERVFELVHPESPGL